MKTGKATCFATLSDLSAFKEAKAKGMSDTEAFAYGDNGIGCWNDNTAQTYAPMCALHPDDMIELWGSIAAAKHQRVLVIYNDKNAECIVGDRLPWLQNTKNEASIDMNPALCIALGLPTENVDVIVTWGKIEDAQPI